LYLFVFDEGNFANGIAQAKPEYHAANRENPFLFAFLKNHRNFNGNLNSDMRWPINTGLKVVPYAK